MLSALLSGKVEETHRTQNRALNPEAFPCLAHAARAQGESAPENEDVDRLSQAELKSREAANAAHTLTSVGEDSLVDYELHPASRRGGQEVVPGSLREGFSLGRSPGPLLNEMVTGSLPRGLSLDERSSIRQSVPASPALNLVNELPQVKVEARTRAGRNLRRSVVRGSVVAFITAGYSGKRFVFEKAAELGVRVAILDAADSWSAALVREGGAEMFLPIVFTDPDTVFEQCLSALGRVRSQMSDLDGVVTFCELAMPLATRLAEHLGLPGNTSDAVDAARNKHATRAAMGAAGLPTPRNFLITDPAQLEEAQQAVGFPAVIKPIHGAASIGVVRVNDAEALATSYHQVTSDLARCKVSAGALVQGDVDGEDGNAGDTISLDIMLEEYLDGPEIDADLVFSEGKCVYGAITDNWPTLEPYFNETGSNTPSTLPAEQQRELMQLAVSSVEVLGFDMGVFHVEAKYTSRGPRLIEVNCRMGGGPVRLANLLVWGVDLVEEHLLCCCGVPSRPVIAAAPLTHLAEFSVNAPVSGVLRHGDYCAAHAEGEDVVYCRALCGAGDKVVCKDDGLPTWVAELMVTQREDLQAAIDKVVRIKDTIEADLPIDR